MSYLFDPRGGLIVLPVELEGPSGSAIVRLALDTGATGTLINNAILVSLGYDPSLASARIQVTTGSKVESVPRIIVQRLTALGKYRVRFPVLAHTLPPSAGVDGLLGLDFLQGHKLTVDFTKGVVVLK